MATRHTSAPAVLRNSDLDSEAVRVARIDLAACFRLAARLGLHEGICNLSNVFSDSGLARPAELMQLAS